MKASQAIFNGVGLFIACMCLFSILSTMFIVMPGFPKEQRGFWYFLISWEAVIFILLGIGGVANFTKGRLLGWSTALMIAAYFIAVWLFPLAIWGIIALLSEQKRQRFEMAKPDSLPLP